MPERTLEEAAEELHSAIVGLREFVEREFPKRVEIQRTFVKKSVSRNRLAVTAIAVFLSMIFNLLASVAIVSNCFLLSAGEDRPQVCTWMPGYQASVDESEILIEEFRQIQERTLSNEKRIKKLEEGQ